jgi:hypothetical protein
VEILNGHRCSGRLIFPEEAQTNSPLGVLNQPSD